jgi:REP element-mobilizing transposase RayT
MDGDWHHLPRLAPETYRGFAVMQWTITMQGRAQGWLDDTFHLRFRELLLHAAAREELFCPAYVLMPDHLHLVWMGTQATSDQRNAMRFLRKYLALELDARSGNERKFQLQKQSHDSVLREQDRTRGAFQRTCDYILNNPCRKELVEHACAWPYLGAVIPGFPFLHPLQENFWTLFWKLYTRLRSAISSS